MQPLPSSDTIRLQSNTNLSTSLSLSILDRHGNEISLRTDVNHSIEVIIPHDPNLVVPLMALQNVTSVNFMSRHLLFNLHFIQMPKTSGNDNQTVALMFEIRPLNRSLGYLLIYRFDQPPQLNSSTKNIDGWFLLCPSSKFYPEYSPPIILMFRFNN